MTKQLRKGILIGQLFGFIYFLSTLIFFWPQEELYLIRSISSKINFFIYSLSFWIVCFIALSTVLYVFFRLINKNSFLINNFFPLFFLIFFFISGYAIYFYYYYKTPTHYPSYLMNKGIIFRVFLAFLVSVFLGLMLMLLSRLKKNLEFKRLQHVSVFTFLFFFLYFIAFSSYNHFAHRVTKQSIDSENLKVVILGLDAASWNILVPLLKEGKLKNINQLMKDSAYGYLDTYGQQFTPKVWTSIATGKKPQKHGIHSFVDRSFNWRAKSFWEILSDNKEKIGVVNWICTYPAFPFNGFLFSKIQKELPEQHYAKYEEDFDIPIEELFIPEMGITEKGNPEIHIKSLHNELENLGRILSFCNNLQSYQLLCFYIYKIDTIQHFFWDDFLAHRDPTALNSNNNFESEKDIFRQCWEKIDIYIGDLLKKFSPDTLFLIVSDHGSRPIFKKELFFNLEKILEVMNYPPSLDEDQSIVPYSVIGEEYIEVSSEVSINEVKKMTQDLKSIVLLPSQKPIFKDVRIINDNDKHLIKIELTSPLKLYSEKERHIKIKGVVHPLSSFCDINPWSGRHRSRGIIILNGPGVVSRYIGSWIVDSPFLFLFRLLHGRAAPLDKIFPVLTYFRLTDPMTTLDIAPTLLPLLGYPVARDMDGKDWSSWLAPKIKKIKETIESYGKSKYLDEKRTIDKEELRKVNEELRALGYIK